MSNSGWIEGKVAQCRRWTDTLFSLRVEAEAIPFEAGQFVKLALPIDGEMIGRPYSFVNAPDERPYEFYCVIVPEGPLSARLAALAPGDAVYLAPRPAGFLVLSEIQDAESLWLICTGTGIGPFLSILKSSLAWRRFRHVVLVHGARHCNELTYRDTVAAIGAAHPSQFRSIGFLSLDPLPDVPAMLAGRIPQAIADGRLQQAAGIPLTAASAQVMLCGNPAMVEETTEVLKTAGMKKHRRRSPGHITVENYW